MDNEFQSQYLPYSHTGKFSKVVVDYVSGNGQLRDFYLHDVSLSGIKAAMEARKQFRTDRRTLVDQLTKQYAAFADCEVVHKNVAALLDENTFTICTAHQPNIFTGHLYFVYKILHTIKLAESLNKKFAGEKFVPVFFMGSEDADLEELNHVVIDGEKFTWETRQTGAVGRMKVDANLLSLIDRIGGRLSVEKHGKPLVDLLKKTFKKDETIEQATFLLVHELFKKYGLIILLPDNVAFKAEIIRIFEDDIFHHTSSAIVQETSDKIAKHYKAQAYPREINLFYLKDNIRNRIVFTENRYLVHDTDIVFSAEEMKNELAAHPERFSPNVILRGLFQEVILPDVAWIGGGGELSYWLQLKDLFQHYSVPYPVLVLRNSFLIIEKKYHLLLRKLDVAATRLFSGEQQLFSEIVANRSTLSLSLENEKKEFENLFYQLKERAKRVDPTLMEFTSALEKRQMKKLDSLEQKMLRAGKRKFSDEKNQIEKVFAALFPNGGLQERTENILLFLAKYGYAFLDMLYEYSLTLEQQFCIAESQN